MSFRGCYAQIELANLVHNLQQIKQVIGANSFICPMVKANAYGHGDVTVAKYLEKASAALSFGVSQVEEGLKLREAGVKSPVLVFGISNEEGQKAILNQNMTPVVSSLWQLKTLDRMATQETKIHLKFDTGMNRLGLRLEEADEVKNVLGKSRCLKAEGLLTHFLRSEDLLEETGDTQKQLHKFRQLIQHLELKNTLTHALNSGAVLRSSQFQNKELLKGLGARPGLLLYGVSPFVQEHVLKQFRPVMSLRACVVRYHAVKAGDTVSYNGTWTAKKDSMIGVVAVGYADGYRRNLSNKGQVLFRGERVNVVGNVCMDFILIDLTHVQTHQPLAEFEEVTLFGKDSLGNLLPVEEVAKKSATIPWEILTSVGARVPRVYL